MVDVLLDGFGRQVQDLRVSVTDRCNFRCTYCMPREDIHWLPRSEILTFAEIERIAKSSSRALASARSASLGVSPRLELICPSSSAGSPGSQWNCR